MSAKVYHAFVGEAGLHINLTEEQARKGYHRGECYEDVRKLLLDPEIRMQLDVFTYEDVKNALRPYGAWDEEELTIHYDNLVRILWLFCVDVVDFIEGDGAVVDGQVTK